MDGCVPKSNFLKRRHAQALFAMALTIKRVPKCVPKCVPKTPKKTTKNCPKMRPRMRKNTEKKVSQKASHSRPFHRPHSGHTRYTKNSSSLFFSLSSVLCNSVPSNPFFSGIFPYVGKFPLKFCEGRRVSSVVENSETLLALAHPSSMDS